MSVSRTTFLVFAAMALLFVMIATASSNVQVMSKGLSQHTIQGPGNSNCGVPSNTWHLKGNRNSNPDVDFLGTGDEADLVIATNCSERVRVLASGETIVHHDLDVGENLSVDGHTSLNDLEVGNDLNIAGDLGVQGHTSIMTLVAGDNATFQHDLLVNGHTSLGEVDIHDSAVLHSSLLVQGESGFIGEANFVANATFNLDVDVQGTTRTGVLEILGADLAEEFPFSEPVQPGMVVEIDPDNAGQLRPAQGAYNRRAAGVIAGANEFSTGIVLGRGSGNEFAAPVALSGRVYVMADATERAVEVGDMLTTSDVPGHAMAVRDYSRMHGAVIGKAMTSMPQGDRGMVLVLVNLQ